MVRKNSYEGRQGHIRKLKTPAIDVWENQYPDKEYEVELEIPEFTCICPKTGLPDFAQISVVYSPDKHCLELKSLKMYTHFYRDVGIFHEHLVNKMLEDMVKSCDPKWMEIEIEMNPRGGITTIVRADYQRPGLKA